MPIRREHRFFYPIDWPQLSAVICGCGRQRHQQREFERGKQSARSKRKIVDDQQLQARHASDGLTRHPEIEAASADAVRVPAVYQ